MNEYATVAQIIEAFEFILPLILISLALSTFLFCIWFAQFLCDLLDFISHVRSKRKAKNIASNDVEKNI